MCENGSCFFNLTYWSQFAFPGVCDLLFYGEVAQGGESGAVIIVLQTRPCDKTIGISAVPYATLLSSFDLSPQQHLINYPILI